MSKRNQEEMENWANDRILEVTVTKSPENHSKSYVYWSDEFQLWEVWADGIPSEYFQYKNDAKKYASTLADRVECGNRH